ncbi:MAG: DUF3047 domain-containing protein [Candidatus Omnitrophica bacterium]|nr:DUF3047 domain-containing protein [Candidatus Omnitrophota bacterium]
MVDQKWLRRTVILFPLLFLLAQIFWHEPPFDQPKKIEKAIRTLIPPLEIIYRYFDFNEKSALARWEEKLFEGRVAYWIDFEDSRGFVHSRSDQSASAIFYRVKFSASDFPYVSWKWRVRKFPDKSGVEDAKKRDDFAARFYVIFISRFFTHFRCVEYVWDETLPEETVLKSPYTGQIKQIVAQSGPAKPGEWITEKRNVFEDYKKLFAKPPKMKVAAIALMTDAEGTGSEAEGFFDDIQIGKSATNRGGSAKQFGGEKRP